MSAEVVDMTGKPLRDVPQRRQLHELCALLASSRFDSFILLAVSGSEVSQMIATGDLSDLEVEGLLLKEVLRI